MCKLNRLYNVTCGIKCENAVKLVCFLRVSASTCMVYVVVYIYISKVYLCMKNVVLYFYSYISVIYVYHVKDELVGVKMNNIYINNCHSYSCYQRFTVESICDIFIIKYSLWLRWTTHCNSASEMSVEYRLDWNSTNR